MTVITTPTIVYRHGDAVPGERIRKILVYDDCISQPNWSVENPDNSDLPETHQSVRHKIELERAGPTGAVRPRDCPPDPVSRVLNSVFVRTLREERAALIKAGRVDYLRRVETFLERPGPDGSKATEGLPDRSENTAKETQILGRDVINDESQIG